MLATVSIGLAALAVAVLAALGSIVTHSSADSSNTSCANALASDEPVTKPRLTSIPQSSVASASVVWSVFKVITLSPTASVVEVIVVVPPVTVRVPPTETSPVKSVSLDIVTCGLLLLESGMLITGVDPSSIESILLDWSCLILNSFAVVELPKVIPSSAPVELPTKSKLPSICVSPCTLSCLSLTFAPPTPKVELE
jgi:hypothetical protein